MREILQATLEYDLFILGMIDPVANFKLGELSQKITAFVEIHILDIFDCLVQQLIDKVNNLIFIDAQFSCVFAAHSNEVKYAQTF